ncbi:PREDICTED: prostaglandin E2 receptor EP2 subtype, partial [Eurypyga helias]|uniref:prostaglandin E2 receptor EP2 subtype n=1 Tax=Eurypyga helias TaxID=54383 RepID=UPI00052804EF
MFSAGLLGNLLALGLLLRCRRGPRARPPSLFHVLVLALVVTDLLGTCSVSPFVLASYHRNLTLTALAQGGHICLYFGFPLVGFGRYVQYCPGTWCFIQMHLEYLQHNGGREVSELHVTFSLLYATLLLFLILAVLLCNLSVIANLARM